MSISRRSFLQSAVALSAGWCFQTARCDAQEIQWHDPTTWGAEGRGWEDLERKRYFDRLPAKAEEIVRKPVWDLSRHSSGMAVQFATDATAIHVAYHLLSPSLALPHMPATGVSGLDLYGQTEAGELKWVQVVRPTQQQIKTQLVRGLDGAKRRYTLYLPLYNGVDSLKIGIPSGSQLTPISPRRAKPIVFYGTSIMQGACASRPGMAISAMLSRRLDLPTINLGFSGNGKMEPEVARLLAELDPTAYCLDCLPNMDSKMVRERARPFVELLRSARPETPILLVEDRVFTNAEFLPEKQQFHRENHQALRETYEQLTRSGMTGLYYLAGNQLLGNDGEGATDGSHPNDLGFLRYATAYENSLRKILTQS